MEVLCIDNSGAKNRWIPIPVVGEKYTVIGEWDDPDGILATAYELAEFGEGYLYPKRLFIPISDIDETAFERNFKKELV